MRRRGEHMFKAAIDERIRDDNLDALRRTLAEARENQARREGYNEGYSEGFEGGRSQGFDEAVEMVLKLLLDFKNGNRS